MLGWLKRLRSGNEAPAPSAPAPLTPAGAATPAPAATQPVVPSSSSPAPAAPMSPPAATQPAVPAPAPTALVQPAGAHTAPMSPPAATLPAPTAKPHVAAPPLEIPHDKIVARAYEIWVRKGKPHGQDFKNWTEAEAELRAEFAAQSDHEPLPRKSR